MDPDQYNLNNLRDIVIPDVPSYWPPAPGLWVALGMVVALVVLVGWWLLDKRQRNAYRKVGLLLLGDARSSYDVAVVLKRVALAVFPREQVASLYGDDWVAFLHRTCPRRYFPAMATSDTNDEPDKELIELAGVWIRHHRVPEAQPVATVT
jgi:uncharacterized protein DUF4381